MSDNYRALTRTYRPTTFDEIVSQQHVSETLKNAIKQNRLAHAYMFCGPRGVGKTSMARVLARTVNEIDHQVDGESLNQTLNVVEIDAASNNSVDDVRDLRERVRIPPQNGRFKIYIIDEVHMLSKAAFNALLKTLEEPPDHVIFIFATTEPNKVLPTILSRVQRFDFKRLGIDEIVERLRSVADNEDIRIDDESLHVIAKKADGALRDALGLMDQAIAFCGSDIQHEELLKALNVVSTDRMFEFMRAVENQSPGEGLQLIDEVLQEGYDIQEFLTGLTEHLRNLYVAKDSERMYLVEASTETKNRYREVAELFSQDDLIRMMHIVSEAQTKIKEAHQPRILFEITLLKLIHMERTENLNRLLAGLEELKKKPRNQPELNDPDETSSSKTNTVNPETTISHGDPRENETDSEAEGPAKSPDTDRPEKPEPTSGQNGTGHNPDEADSELSMVTESTEDAGTEQPEKGSDFFGTPSLGTFNDNVRQAEPRGDGDVAAPAGSEEDTAEQAAVAPEDLTLEYITGRWEDYLEMLKKQLPQMLYFQMMRVEPVRLKHRELHLRCNDDFAKQVIEENKRELSRILKEQIGIFIQLTCEVRNDKNKDEDSKSPYERFMMLQKKDPKIKKLVELFGAELDYNLNQ